MMFLPVMTEPIMSPVEIFSDQTIFTQLLQSNDQPGQFIVEMLGQREVDFESAALMAPSVCEFSVMEAPTLPTDGERENEERFYFCDYMFNGRPQDAFLPNRVIPVQLVESLNQSRRLSLTPEQAQKSVTSSGQIRLANADASLEDIAINVSVKNRYIKVHYGPVFAPIIDETTEKQIDVRQYDFKEYRQQVEVLGSSISGDRGEIVVETTSPNALLQGTIYTEVYGGSGGLDGDTALRNRPKPQVYGSPDFIEPVLISASFLIYQAAANGQVSFNTVYDGGEPLNFDTNYNTFAELATATIANGSYATCRALGIFRLGATPASAVRCDVSSFLNSTAEIITDIATTRGGLDISQINIGSLGGLPADLIGYYLDGTTDRSTLSVIQELLIGVYGFMAPGATRQIFGGLIQNPETKAIKATLDDAHVINFELELNRIVSRKSQRVLYDKIWAPLTEEQFLGTVGLEERTRLSSSGSIAQESRAEVGVLDRGAENRSALTTFFKSQTPARDVAGRILDVHDPRVRHFRVKTTRAGMTLREGDNIRVYHERYGAQDGLDLTIYESSSSISSRRHEYEFLCFG